MDSDDPGNVTILLLPVPPQAHRSGVPTECAFCGARYPVKRTAMRLSARGFDLGQICPECVLLGPKGTAGRLRSRKAWDPGVFKPADLESWNDLLDGKAEALETIDAFPIAARQVAIRETRERR